MKKRIFAILMAVIMVMTLVIGAMPTMAADEGTITVRIHYHRPDGDYEGWELWSWDLDGKSDVSGTSAKDGSAVTAPPYKFEAGTDEVVATITVPTGTMRIGYIARFGEWVKKDVADYDQFINLTGILSGTVDFYIEAGVPSQTSGDLTAIPSMETLCSTGGPDGKPEKFMVLGNDVVQGVVVMSADYEPANSDGKPEVTVQLSAAPKYTVTKDTFTIVGREGNVKILDCVKFGSSYYLTLEKALPLDQGFNISFEGHDYSITMPDYYSTAEFEEKYTYKGNDLGATYSKEQTTLRVWAPLAEAVQVWLYTDGNPATQAEPVEKVDMTPDVNGTWVATLSGDKNGTYYTYWVNNTSEQKECVDPYARTTGVNGRRGMIIDLASTNPEGWENDKDPNAGQKITDYFIWELHVRDLSSDSSSGIKNVGKFLGLIETGTKNSHGQSTGLDYIKDLGITHIHLLPVYDYGSVDETVGGFNWGYDPMNYNVPEGSYSTDPYNGEVRVKEFKQMVKGLHDNGISVIMDVVYNHVYDSNQFCMNNTVPNYFSRPNSNGSGCGNDTASERSMVSKYIVDSVNYWADEYHIDGFRFDLVGLIDVNTINELVKTVQAKHPNVIFYGEGWTMGTATTKPGTVLATQTNSTKTPNFAYFSDTIRNALKGGTFGGVSAGYISGGSSNDLNACFKGMPSWCKTPSQSINYISCHDNNALYDHISIVKPNATVEEKVAMNKLGVAFYMAAQGVPFMQAGEEMLRSKPDATKPDGYNENSYNAPDSVNSIKWDELWDVNALDLLDYYKGMIAFRKAHPALRLSTASEVTDNVFNLSGLEANVLGYRINGGVNGETADGIVCIYNANAKATEVTLPEGEWNICVNKDTAGVYSLGKVSGTVTVDGVSAMILVQGDVAEAPAADNNVSNNTENKGSSNGTNWTLVIIVWAVVAVICAGAVLLLLKKK
jgi:pullulanase